jgi:AraC family transcriptional regulator
MLYIESSIDGVPEVDRAVEFPLTNPVFDFAYRSPTYSLHLYGYDGEIRIGSEQNRFRAGDVTCAPPGVVRAYNTSTPGKHWAIHFYDTYPEGSPTFQIPCHIQFGSNALFIREQFRIISRLFNSPVADARNSMYQAEASYRLKALLISLHNLSFTHTSGTRGQSSFVWEELMQIIDENLAMQISTSWLAKKMNIGANTLSRKFKQEYGCTISQYMLKKRIDKAKALLTTTTMTVYEVGSSVGITDPQYFNKQFRKSVGTSPSRYRDENKTHVVYRSDDDILIKDGSWKTPD